MNADTPIIDTVEEASLPTIDCLKVAGIFGDTDVKAFADKEKRSVDYKSVNGYQEVLTCPHCGSCIEFRAFTPNGEAYTVGRYCQVGELSVSEHGTCQRAYPRRKGRKRVIYDGTNAPAGFDQGLAPVTMKRLYTKRDQYKALLEESRGYRGGSSSYQRADGEKEAVGSGKIPKGLGN